VQLVLQFLGESLLYTTLAAGLGLALANLALPSVNVFLDSGGQLALARDPVLAAAIVLGILVVALLAGCYPALVLSGFRPALVLKGLTVRAGGAITRQALVVVQFAILVGLLIAAAVIYRQRIYAVHDVLRVDADQILIIRGDCKPALLNELRALPGVRAAHCSSQALLNRSNFTNSRLRDGTPLAIDTIALDFGALSLYGIEPLAGTLAAAPNASQVVINETAARRFGFTSAAAAIGQPLPLENGAQLIAEMTGAGDTVAAANQIVAVVADFAFDAALHKVRPTIYTTTVSREYPLPLLNVQLSGRDIPQTLEAIDRSGIATGRDKPPERFFLSQYMNDLYAAVLREAQAVGVFAALAAVLACLGLLGLSAATAESRTKEIGVRKAMGAATADIVRMLLWQFSVPVLWASLVACLVSGVLLGRWLEGFSDHVALSPLVFLAASATALVIALATVLGQSLLIARARPADALRYE
jgi:putative ABC transport system permease protein